MIDVQRYRTLLLRAVHTVLQPFGISEKMLENWLLVKAGYGAPAGVIPEIDAASPLFSIVDSTVQPLVYG